MQKRCAKPNSFNCRARRAMSRLSMPISPASPTRRVISDQVAAIYWLKAKDFGAWSKLPEVVEWRARIAKLSSVGLWWEPVAVDADYMETIAFKEFLRGFSGCPVGFATTEGTGYWGAARDRIPAAAYDLFEPVDVAAQPEEGAAKIPYRKVQPPKNMTVIRSGVSWEHCEGEQLKDYQERIRPALDAGMDYLRNNPRDTGCFALRQLGCVSPSGDDIAEGYSLGAFVSLGHLKSWAKDHRQPSRDLHPRTGRAAKKYQEKLQLRTYNEISSSTANNPPFEYFNCPRARGVAVCRRAGRRRDLKPGFSCPPKSSPRPFPRSSRSAYWYCPR